MCVDVEKGARLVWVCYRWLWLTWGPKLSSSLSPTYLLAANLARKDMLEVCEAGGRNQV